MNNLKTDSRLSAALAASMRAVDAMTPAERAEMIRRQRLSYAVGEAGMGNDAQEAEYASAVAAGDTKRIAEFDAEAEVRMAAVKRMMSREDL